MGVLALSVPLARTSNPSGLRPRRGKDFWFLARSENLRLAGSSPVGTFSPRREPVTTPPYAGAGALPSGPRAYALGGITVFTSSRARKKPSPRCVESSRRKGTANHFSPAAVAELRQVPAAGEHPPPALLSQVSGSLFLSSRLNLTPQKVENTPRDGRNLRSNGHEHLGRGAKI